MKHHKRLIALIMAVLMVVMSFAGCSKKSGPEELAESDIQQSTVSNGLANSFEDADGVSYVLVYNPDIYDEFSRSNTAMATGDFDQNVVDTTAVRAGELPDQSGPNIVPKSQSDWNDSYDNYNPSADRAGRILVTPYAVGDTKDFYTIVDDLTRRVSQKFVCRYSGEHCCIWTVDGVNDVTDDKVNDCGQKFDSEIYEKEVELFGQPIYAEDGGKIHLLIYNFGSNHGMSITLGFFNPYDLLYTSGQVTEDVIAENQINVDHAIINVNSEALNIEGFEDSVYNTIVHEYQHLIFGSSIMCEPVPLRFHTWLNEALSGYVETVFYPGSKQSHILSMQRSDRIRYGQSLYNFDVDDGDIGVYGSVYLFSQFIASLGDDKTMHGIHDYIRTTSDPYPTSAGALYEALGPDVVQKIDSTIVFPDSIKFADDKTEFISKLTLAFYLSMLNGEIADPEAFKDVDRMTLLYNQLDGSNIQGGGRVLLAVKGGKFQIPANADRGLLYIGLDKDFKPVTNIISQ